MPAHRLPGPDRLVTDGGPAGEEGAPVPVTLIRQGLEAAWLVGRAGLAASPPLPAPRRLQPLLRFAKLPAKGLATVRDVVEGDAEFRSRVVASVDEGRTERASWLWLARPEGWAEELAALGAGAEAAARDAHESRAERSARRRLEAAEAARARSDDAAEQARRLAAERQDELVRERQGRRVAEAALAEARAGIDGALQAAEQGAETAAAASREAAMAEAAAADLRAELGALRAERDRLAGEVERLAAAADTARAGERRSAEDAARGRRRAGDAVLDAARAAQALGAALARAAGELGAPGLDSGSPGAGGSGAGGSAAGAPPAVSGANPSGIGVGPVAEGGGSENPGGARETGAGGRVPGPSRRRPRALRSPGRRQVPIPVGLFADSVEAAVHLVRRPGALLLVDGYNVSLTAWPGVGLADQRQRLAAALGELAARTGVSIHVVFDASAEEQLPPPAGTSRRPVRISFSASGEDADEVLIELVELAEDHRPVVVATDDRRVRAEVEQRGANTISVRQLLGVLGRRGHAG